MPYLFLDSVQGNLILEGLELFVSLSFQSLPKLLTEVPTLSLWQPPEASGGGNNDSM